MNLVDDGDSLDDHDAVGRVEHGVDGGEVAVHVLFPYVLEHFYTDDAVVASFWLGGLAVIGEEDLGPSQHSVSIQMTSTLQ